jgi:ABC-type uncharacterized transport system involved in gliding motility auxiliary subunit
MNKCKKYQLHLFIQHHAFVLFFLTLVALLGFLSYQYHALSDVTQDNRNTVSEGSEDILKQMQGTVSVTAFAPDDEAFRQSIKNFIARYKRTKSDIKLSFINAATEPRLAQEAAIKANGELVIEYQKRSEHLIPPYTEQEFTNVLIHLSRTHRQAVMILSGHGERSFVNNGNHDFGAFAKQLALKGFSLAQPNLISTPSLPRDGAMLIITSPKVNITAIEVTKIKTYLESGGNLLWLLDDENLHGLDEIAKYLGLEVTQGLVIDQSAAEFGGDPKTAVAVQYGDHPVTENFRIRTSFPEARKVAARGTYENGWQVQDLIHVAPNGWLQNDLKKTSFNEKQDIPGPINIALSIERKYGKKGQRVVVVGNANFLSNTFIINGGNLDLGLNMVNWLAGDDNLITIQPTLLKDSNLNLTAESNYKLVFISFQILIPLGLLIFGVFTWWNRRKA